MKTFALLIFLGVLSSGVAFGGVSEALAYGNRGGSFQSSLIAEASADGASFYLLKREGRSADFLLVAEKDGKVSPIWGDVIVSTRLGAKLPSEAYAAILAQWASWLVKTQGAEKVRALVDQSENALKSKGGDWVYEGAPLDALKSAVAQ
jgi:hypothetical protein